jgi:hypothetical protein
VVRIRDVYPGSRIRIFPSRIPIKEFKYGILTQKLFLSSRKYDPGCSTRIRIPFLPIPDPGVKKAPDPDPQHWKKLSKKVKKY